MEIDLETKKIQVFREAFHQIKRIQTGTESVVPDVNEDIGKIVTVQSAILLKNKDIVADGVNVGGEVQVSILYITEMENSVSQLKLSKSFELNYETIDIESDANAQINLQISNIEARVINPRKVSVTLEICGELSCYITDEIDDDSFIPEEKHPELKTNKESISVMLPNAVCEKAFAINEQYTFPTSKAGPSQLVFQKVSLDCTDNQQVGSKLIVKGNVNVSVCYFSKENPYPIFTQFNSPFSQIVDTGTDESDNCSIKIELTSNYFELIETISGEYALDMELHALIQIVSRKKRSISYISDAYCNLMPVENKIQKLAFSDASQLRRETITFEEKLNVADECEDVICVIPSMTQASIMNTTFGSNIHFDILYKSTSGNIASVRRAANANHEDLPAGSRLIDCKMNNIDFRPNETIIDAVCSIVFLYQTFSTIDCSRVCSVEIMEDKRYDVAAFPSVSIVRVENESLWDLAKHYHSSVEKICLFNNTDNIQDSMLMIPKEC